MNTAINLNIFNEFPELQSERLYFRAFIFSDAAHLFEIRSNAEVMTYMDRDAQTEVTESEKMIDGIQDSFENKEGINWAIIEKDSHEFIGYFGYWRIEAESCRAEIGYALKPEFQGKGYMRETLKTMIAFGFNEMTLHSIEANINPANVASQRLLENASFKKEAHFRENWFFNGKFIDSAIYGLLESDFN
ncbi:MAG: GNAT family N-acetyltransferase [Bacteroidales bacterium]|nr:GNAT family N-acetyltransferase [Bacteroidales bacterium]